MVSRRTNFGERSEPAPDRGGKLQSAGAAQSNVSPLLTILDDRLVGEFVMLSHVASLGLGGAKPPLKSAKPPLKFSKVKNPHRNCCKYYNYSTGRQLNIKPTSPYQYFNNSPHLATT